LGEGYVAALGHVIVDYSDIIHQCADDNEIECYCAYSNKKEDDDG